MNFSDRYYFLYLVDAYILDPGESSESLREILDEKKKLLEEEESKVDPCIVRCKTEEHACSIPFKIS